MVKRCEAEWRECLGLSPSLTLWELGVAVRASGSREECQLLVRVLTGREDTIGAADALVASARRHGLVV